MGYETDTRMTDDSGSDLDQTQAAPVDRGVPCARLIGAAGTGKTTYVIRRVAEDPSFALLTSTTGISAVNLGAITVHSTLRYSDTASLRDAFLSGRLARTLHEIALTHRNLLIEEYSMLDADQLDLIYRGVEEANRYADVHEPLGIMLVGDLAQLPPVKGRWCFEADSWEKFAANTTRLDHVWRQDGGLFLDALNHARSGDGRAAADTLTRAGAVWHTQLYSEFDGTTILPKNDMVNRYNALALDRVPGMKITVESRRWGQQRSEWGENPRSHEWGIPPRLDLKIGAYVMLLANASDFSVVNGDCGHVAAYVPATPTDDAHFIVHLVRTDREVNVYRIVRGCETPERPDGWDGVTMPRGEDDGGWIARQHFRGRVRRYVLGQVEYYPMRLAYASTVHKSQSLTLDRVQCDFRDWFFGRPSMLYVALSRCRTLAGLRLVGGMDRFVKQCAAEPRVKEWL